MAGHDKQLTLDDFERLLEVYGSDRDRWPEPLRSSALALAAGNAAAARTLVEAQALDRVLAFAPEPDPARLPLLADRIVAAAMADAGTVGARPAAVQPAHPAGGARVIPLPGRKGPAEARPADAARPDVAAAGRRRLPVVPPARSGWRATAALAASLALGVMLGVADLTPMGALGLGPVSEAQAGEVEQLLSVLHVDTLNAFLEDQI